MPDSPASTFLVAPDRDPVAVRIMGRASFQNSGCLQDFFEEMLRQERGRFVLDFAHCTGMDSTFLGVLAGTALDLRRRTPPGSLVAVRLGARNLELVRNLGLHRLITVDGETEPAWSAANRELLDRRRSELEQARLVLAAHENLLAADESNRHRFQDVITFLRQGVQRAEGEAR